MMQPLTRRFTFLERVGLRPRETYQSFVCASREIAPGTVDQVPAGPVELGHFCDTIWGGSAEL